MLLVAIPYGVDPVVSYTRMAGASFGTPYTFVPTTSASLHLGIVPACTVSELTQLAVSVVVVMTRMHDGSQIGT